MIKVLQNWEEIGEATKIISQLKLPKHQSGEKAWDLYHLYQTVDKLPRDAKVIDMGCGGAFTLKFLYEMGFSNLEGVDLGISWMDRLIQFSRMWRKRTLKKPFSMKRGDLTQTGLPTGHFDLAVCLSVIEHGVNVEAFLKEASRLLKPGGLLFVTCDYWEEDIKVSDDIKAFGCPWQPLSREDIHDMIIYARSANLTPVGGKEIPACRNRCVSWQDTEFTFSLQVFRKEESTS